MALPDLSALDLGAPTGPIVTFTDEHQAHVARRTRAGCKRRADDGGGEVCVIGHEPLQHGAEVYQLPGFEGRPGAFVNIHDIYAWWRTQRAQGRPMTNPVIPIQRIDEAEWILVRDWILREAPPPQPEAGLFSDGVIERQRWGGVAWDRVPGVDAGLLSYNGSGAPNSPGSMPSHALRAATRLNRTALFSRVGKDVKFTWKKQLYVPPPESDREPVCDCDDFLIEISAEPGTRLHAILEYWLRTVTWQQYWETLTRCVERAAGIPPGRLGDFVRRKLNADLSPSLEEYALGIIGGSMSYYHTDGRRWTSLRTPSPEETEHMRLVFTIELPMWLMRNLVETTDINQWESERLRPQWMTGGPFAWLLSPDNIERTYERAFGLDPFADGGDPVEENLAVANSAYFGVLKWGVLVAQSVIAYGHARIDRSALYFISGQDPNAGGQPAVYNGGQPAAYNGMVNIHWGGRNYFDQNQARHILGLWRRDPPVVPDWYDPGAPADAALGARKILWGNEAVPGLSPRTDGNAFCRAGQRGLPQVVIGVRDNGVTPESFVSAPRGSRLVQHTATTRVPLWYCEYV
jgi:hypothetical protein